MSTIKIEFPADRVDIAKAMAKALHRIAYGETDEAPKSMAAEPTVGTQATPCDAGVTVAIGTAPTADEESDSLPNDAPVDNSTSLFQQNGPAADALLDLHGVAKDDKYCGSAKEPFYQSGKRRGQWKKRQGVSEEDYDAWYAAELGKRASSATPGATASPTSTTTPQSASVNAGAAFGATQQPPQSTTGTPVFSDAGEFVKWMAESRAAGTFTQDDVNNAQLATGVDIGTLFGPQTADELKAKTGALVDFLLGVRK